MKISIILVLGILSFFSGRYFGKLDGRIEGRIYEKSRRHTGDK